MVDLTVAIPTYNGETRLPQLLERLRHQKNTEDFSWEIVVVDNNSSDRTAELIQQTQATWNQPWPLRYSFESQQGLAFARQRCITEAQGQLVGFLDDDNLPDSNWVAAAYHFAQTHPQAGAFGGQIHPQYETPPPANIERIQSFLAIRERGNQPHRYQPETLSLPPGAALVVRKQAWCDQVPPVLQLKGRVNGVMLAGEDYEALLHLHQGGWEIWYNPAMHTHHQIPHWRLEKDYLLNLIRGSCLCLCYLRLMHLSPWQKPWVMTRMFLGSLRRAAQHFLKHRQELQTDLIAACEMEFFLSSLTSPWFYLKQQRL